MRYQNKIIMNKVKTLKETKNVNAVRSDKSITRGNTYAIDPREIVADFDKHVDKGGNPRKNYGTPEEWAELKESIKVQGVLQNIKIYVGADNKYHLRHGYRRLKAVLELIEEGHDFKKISFDIVSNNEEQALVDHLVLNTGKPLNDLEKAETIMQLSVLTGINDATELAKKTFMSYQKVSQLMKFMGLASHKLKTGVANKKISFSTALNLAVKASGIREQNALLTEGEKNREVTGGKKVQHKHIPVLRQNLSFDTQFGLLIGQAATRENVDHEFLVRLRGLITLIKDNAPLADQLEMFDLQKESA